METRSAANRRRLRNPNYFTENNTTGDDRITDLPDDVIHHILLFLSIRSIAQTSILSKRWRTIWYTLPDLDFITTDHQSKTIGIEINRILSVRDKVSAGQVRILRFKAYMTFSGLHTLFRNAVRLRVQELDIQVATDDMFNLPRCIITHDCLKVLKMKSDSGFRLPPSIIIKSGFQTLETLSLSNVHVNNQTSSLDLFTDSSFPQLRKLSLTSCKYLKHLRVGCRLLEQLVIRTCFSLEGLEILTPRLETLNVSYCFDAVNKFDHTFLEINAPRLHTIFWSDNWITSNNICIQNLVCLHTATLGFIPPEILDAKKIKMLSSFLSGLQPHKVSSLTVERSFVEIMSKNNPLPAIFFNQFEKLKSLKLFTTDAEGLASILKVCPIIHTLTIHTRILNTEHVERRWNRQISWDLLSSWKEEYLESVSKDLEPLLHHLAVVKIHGSAEYAISLVKFFLKHGKVLQDLTLYIGHYYSSRNIRLEDLKSRVNELPRASIDAKLTIH